MNIGLITFHNALNYGAALQTYATQKFLNELGHQCIIIDYSNKNRDKAYNMRFQAYKQIKEKNYKMALKMVVGSIFMAQRRRSFDKFYNKYTLRTEKKYKTSKELEELNEKFDFFLVGSDQVWNPKNNGADMTYLLEFVNDNKKKISYASSFGVSAIPQELVLSYSENLNNIKYLSTREEMGAEIIRRLTGRDAKVVLDPVFLLNRKQWEALAQREKAEKSKFIFVYTNRENQFEKMVKTTGINLKEYKIHKISRFIKPLDFINYKVKVDYSISPEKFLSNIMNADLVATASFHCVAFSIIFHKKFVVFLTGDRGRDERIINLLKIVGLTDRIYNDSTTLTDVISEINYKEVEEKLSPHINESKEFLVNILNK